MADAGDLKSSVPQGISRFDPGLRHQGLRDGSGVAMRPSEPSRFLRDRCARPLLQLADHGASAIRAGGPGRGNEADRARLRRELPYESMANRPRTCYGELAAMASFEWDSDKELENRKKHGVSFAEAQYAFADERRVIAEDLEHSTREKRYFCFGLVARGVVTVRFNYRSGTIRIIGAGFWRKGKAIYEHEEQVHK